MDVYKLSIGDIVKIKTSYGKTIFLEVSSIPYSAHVMNGISEKGEWVIQGYLLTKKLHINRKVKSTRNTFIIKESNIEIIKRNEDVSYEN